VPVAQGQVLRSGANRAAVLGSPIAHSLSPTLHNAGYAALGLTDWSYAAEPVEVTGFSGFVAGLDASWRGLSLTMPLKEVAFGVTVSVSVVAEEAGSINTLIHRPDGHWDGDNTDVVGLARALAGVEHGGGATVLGAGATARSAVLALRSLGVGSVRVAARRPEAVAALADWAGRLSGGAVLVTACELGGWADDPSRLVVSTLPPGPSATVGGALDGAGSSFEGVTLLDVVYADWPTPLARAASAHGMQVISGLDMLVHQAAEQFRLFTGHEAPVEAMAAAGRAELVRRSGASRDR